MPRMTTQQESARVTRGNIVFTFALVLALYVAWILRDVLVLLYVSALFAVVLSPAVRATSSQPLAVAPVPGIGGHFYPLAGGGWADHRLRLSRFPTHRSRSAGTQRRNARAPSPVCWPSCIKFHSLTASNSSDIVNWIQGSLNQTASLRCSPRSRNWAGALARIVAGFVLTLYFLLEGDRAYHWFLSFLPPQPATSRRHVAARSRFAWKSGFSVRPASCSSWA